MIANPPGRLTGDGHIRRYGKSAGTPNGGKGISGAMDATEAMLSEQHHDLHVPFLIRPKVTGRIDYRQLFHY